MAETKELDLGRIKRNVRRMVDQGAPMEEIDHYISLEGATVEQVRDFRPEPPNAVGRALNWMGGVASSAVEAVRGKQDPAFADVPTFKPVTGEGIEQFPIAKMTAVDDEAFGDVLRKGLGDRFIRTERDANGNPVLVYRDDTGREAKGYVNKPGLDWEDLDRALSVSAPFLAAGGLVGSGMKAIGAGMTPRVVGQGISGLMTSLGLDVGASNMGSEQPADLERAAIAGGLGAVGEAAAPYLSSLFRGSRGAAQHVDEQGRLVSPQARKAAQDAGLNPDEVPPEMAIRIAAGIDIGTDPAEAVISAQTGHFGIPTTKGQRTKDPALLSVEKDITYGNLGREAQNVLDDVKKRQAAAIRQQALGRESGEGASIATGLAPHRTPGEVHPQTFGTSIREGLTAAREAEEAAVSAAWPKTDILPRPQAFDSLPDALAGQIGGLRLDARLTPAAMEMDAALAAWRSGKSIIKDGPQVVKQAPVRTVDEMRKHLGSMIDAAQTPTDRRAAQSIYRGFNDWVEQAADQGMLTGTAADVAAFRSARELTREVKGLFQPRDKAGRSTPGAKLLEQVMEGADSAESIVARLFTGPQSPPRQGAVEALKQMRTILHRQAKRDRSVTSQVWNDVRLAYWTKLVTDRRGNVLEPGHMRNALDAAFRNQKSAMDVLFSPQEQSTMRLFAKALDEATFKDPNPSGTASALRAMMRNEDSAIKTLLQTQSKRELFSKHNVFMSRIYQVLAKKVPADVFGTKSGMALKAAQRAASQDLTLRPPRVFGHFGGAIGGQQSE